MPTLEPPVSAAELKMMIGVIIGDVMEADLDPSTKKILIHALQHIHPWLEVRRRQRQFN
jgi:hypothetical protein